MGSCFTRPSLQNHREITQYLRQAKREDGRADFTFQLFLRGNPSSGKTTLYQQIQRLHNGTLLEPNDKYLKKVRTECVETMLYLLDVVHDTESIQTLNSLSIDHDDDLEKIGNIIDSLWLQYGGFNDVISSLNQYEFVLNPNIGYFMENIRRIMDNQTRPVLSDEDVIRFQVHCPQTSDGVCQFEYEHCDNTFVVSDIMMSYESTRKRLHYFGTNDSTMVSYLFVAALSDYCEVLDSDGSDGTDRTVNAMQDVLSEFDRLVNEPVIRERNVILILNKFDIFKERVCKGIPLSVCFDDWTGPDGPSNSNVDEEKELINNALRFVKNKFAECIEIPRDPIHPVVVNAIDMESVREIWETVHDRAIRHCLRHMDMVNFD